MPDPRYNSALVTRFINKIMQRGKKGLAERIMYDALQSIHDRTGQDPLEVFERAVSNATPMLEVKPRRVGGATYQVPVQIEGQRRQSLAIRWLLTSARNRPGKTMSDRLANELLDAFPVHRVIRHGDGMREVYVALDGDRFVDDYGPLSTPALAAYFDALGVLPGDGCIAEVNRDAPAWIAGVASRLAMLPARGAFAAAIPTSPIGARTMPVLRCARCPCACNWVVRAAMNRPA